MSEMPNEETLVERLAQYAGGCDNTRLYCPDVFLPECEPRMNEWLASLAAALRESVGALKAAEARAVRCEGVVDAIRQHCRVIYFPDLLSYPIEHSLLANKDMWDVLLAKLEVHR